MPLGVNNIVLITYRSQYASQRYLLTHTYRVGSTTSTQTPALDSNDIALSFSQTGALELLDQYAACLGNNVQIREVIAQAIHPTRFVRASLALAVDGAGLTPASTGNIAGTITLRTFLAGRDQVAVKHVGPPMDEGVNAGAPSAGLFNALNTLGSGLVSNRIVDCTTAGETITLEPVIFHRASGTASGLADWVVSDRIGTMRRRTLRVGE